MVEDVKQKGERRRWMIMIKGRQGIRRRRRRRRSWFEVIAVNQLSCGAGDSLSKGMREAQIAISAPTQLVHPEMIFNHPHILDCSTQLAW